MLTTLPPTTLTLPLCLVHRNSALGMTSDLHVSIPECDEASGLYMPMQCDRHKKYCWCVNVDNGVEVYGTRKAGTKPLCSD
jgi:hypothetical protein